MKESAHSLVVRICLNPMNEHGMVVAPMRLDALDKHIRRDGHFDLLLPTRNAVAPLHAQPRSRSHGAAKVYWKSASRYWIKLLFDNRRPEGHIATISGPHSSNILETRNFSWDRPGSELVI